MTVWRAGTYSIVLSGVFLGRRGEWRGVTGFVRGSWGIRQPLPSLYPDLWQVDHVPTGRAAIQARSVERAKAFVWVIDGLLDWSQITAVKAGRKAMLPHREAIRAAKDAYAEKGWRQ